VDDWPLLPVCPYRRFIMHFVEYAYARILYNYNRFPFMELRLIDRAIILYELYAGRPKVIS